jgi:Skp family chaperone for outer membrane proteins
MTTKPIAAGLSAAAIALTAGSAFAQAPAAAPVPSGPPIAGVCVVDLDGVVATSTVGKYVQTRLQQIQAQINAELNGENAAINNDAKALDGQRATLDQGTFEQRGAAIQVRANALNRKIQLREREFQVTEQKAVGRVLQEAEQPVRQAYQGKGCSLLLQKNAVLGGFFNPAMDITAQVVAGLNAKIQTFTFDRERLDQPQPTAAGGAPPIVQTPGPAPRPATPPKR